jgi:hypothetical protein
MRKWKFIYGLFVICSVVQTSPLVAEEVNPCLSAIDAFKATLTQNKADLANALAQRKVAFSDIKSSVNKPKDKPSAYKQSIQTFKDNLIAQKELRLAALEVVKSSCGIDEDEDKDEGES